MLVVYLLLFINQNVAAVEHIDVVYQFNSCTIGDKVQNERIKCVCKDYNIYKCNALEWDTKTPDFMYDATQALYSTTGECHASLIYVLDNTTCICNKTGQWPHDNCRQTFHSLPHENVTKRICEPNSYVIIGCNVCKCNDRGEIDNYYCTRNNCKDTKKGRRSRNLDSVYGSCEPKNWYSLAPCQFCYCVNENKLVCNTGNYKSNKLQLGNYNLTVCGKTLIRDAIELIPDGQQVLRGGEKNQTDNLTQTTTHAPTTTTKMLTRPTPPYAEDNIIDEATKEVRSEGKLEYYTDSSEEINNSKQNDTVVKIVPSTQLPFQEDPGFAEHGDVETSAEDKNEDDNTENETEVTVPQVEVTSPVSNSHSAYFVHPNEMDTKGDDIVIPKETVRINLPMVLDKVLKLALRKSMVTLDSTTKCEPGSSKVVKCNVCYCLKNGKMLCTDKTCE